MPLFIPLFNGFVMLFFYFVYSLILLLLLSLLTFIITRQLLSSVRQLSSSSLSISSLKSEGFLDSNSFNQSFLISRSSLFFRSLSFYCNFLFFISRMDKNDYSILFNSFGGILEKNRMNAQSLYNFSLALSFQPFYLQTRTFIYHLLF